MNRRAYPGRFYRRAPMSTEGLDELVRLYALRMIAPQLADNDPPDYEVAMWLLRRPTAKRLGGPPKDSLSIVRALRRLTTRLQGKPVERRGPIVDLTAELATLVGLDETEHDILLFTVLLEATRLAQFVMRDLSGERELGELLARALAIPFEQITAALAPDGALRGGGLVLVDPSPGMGASAIAPAELVVSVCQAGVSPQRVLDHLVPRAPAPTLDLDAFAHLGEPLRMLRRYLERLLAHGGGKLQVLVHGPAGVGKSELVRALAASLQCSLHEVRFEDAAGQPLEPTERLLAYRLVQRLLGKQPHALLVFEEIEDLFPRRLGLFGPVRESAERKALTNRTLETARVPTFFVSNDVEHIDPAVLRRFDFVISLGVPPRAVRRRIVGKHLDGLLTSDAWLDRLADRADLPPSEIDRAARFVRGLDPGSSEGVERALDLVLTNGRRTHAGRLAQCVLPYDLAAIRTDVPVGAIIDGLAREGQGAVLFSGPPGTGKTEAAHEVARRLDRPVIAKRASSLLDKYVGQTEKNLARAFEEALDEDAVLLLDEIDSFLRPREQAHYGWEVTQVNELLVQIERFEGVLIATTNFIDGLDRAALRRFAVKVQFLPPTSDQTFPLLLATLRALGMPPPPSADEPHLRARLANMRALAPGHFAAAVRSTRLLGAIDDAHTFVERLEREHAHEPDARRRAGFA